MIFISVKTKIISGKYEKPLPQQSKKMNKYNHILVIFGGQDPEEQAARAVALANGCATATATINSEKVAAFNAYKANGFTLDSGVLSEVSQTIIFECSTAAAGEMKVIAQCDHHNPGDHGYGLGPDKFWEASALGQLCAVLGVEATPELEIIAAGDHCPADAYAGSCAGIDPAEFMKFRIAGKVAFYASNPRTADKADAEKIRVAIEAAKIKLAQAEQVDGVCDLRDAGMIDELPEAALSRGMAYMASLPDTNRDRNPTGNTKYVLGGHTTPEIVKNFMAWGNGLPNKVADAYGNPTRGFAGVVVKP
jgi:hypothetical protein